MFPLGPGARIAVLPRCLSVCVRPVVNTRAERYSLQAGSTLTKAAVEGLIVGYSLYKPKV